MPSKLYVGNLAYAVSNDDLNGLFSQIGQVQSATVVTDAPDTVDLTRN